MCLNKADELAAAIDLRPDDHIGNLLPVSFGAGITALIMGLMNGVTVFCWDPRIDGVSGIDDWLIENSITTTHCAPSFLRAWSDLDCDAANDDSIGSLRVVVTYGGSSSRRGLRAPSQSRLRSRHVRQLAGHHRDRCRRVQRVPTTFRTTRRSGAGRTCSRRQGRTDRRCERRASPRRRDRRDSGCLQ